MNVHLSENQFASYVYHTLTDAQRETMDVHIGTCQACRVRLAEHQALHRRARYSILDRRRGGNKSSQANFAEVAPRLRHSRRMAMFWTGSKQFVYGAATLAVLAVLTIGLVLYFQGVGQSAVGGTSTEELELEEPATVAPTEIIKPSVTASATEEQQPEETPTETLLSNPIPGESDPTPGKLRWKVKVEGQAASQPAIVDGVVYYGTGAGLLYAVEAQTGHGLWVSEIGGPVQQEELVVLDGVIYAGSKDNHIYAVDNQNGQKLWDFDAGNSYNTVGAGDGVIYVGSTNLHAVDAKTGQELWQFETGGRVKPAPRSANSVVYAETDGVLYAVDAQTGQELWQFNFEDPVRWGWLSDVVDGVIYVGTDSSLYAVDIKTGQAKWRYQATRHTPVFSIEAGTVYVGGGGGQVYALDSQTGQELWQFKAGGPVDFAPSVVDGIVYVGSADHQLYTLDSQTGQVLWQFAADGDINGPAIADGVVYFGDDSGHLYAVWAGEPEK
jgi:outer membrane protein assembly factor BamB